MSQITIEAIEKILEKVPNATYKQAKEALINNDGDIVEAIMELQDKLGKPKKEIFGKDKDQLKEQAIDLIKKSKEVKIIIEKNGQTILNVPMAVGVVGAIVGPMAMLLGVGAAVLSKSKIKIANDDTVLDLGEFSIEKFNLIKDLISGKIKESNTKKVDNSKFGKDEVDEIVININKEDK